VGGNPQGNASGKGPLVLGLRRFSRALEPSEAQDALLDLVIAAEALYLEGAPGELKYRLAQRMALYLENSFERRRHVLVVAASMYDA